MVKNKLNVGRGVRWRNLLIAACAGFATLWTSAANATITQGDFSVFGFFETRESGRWGEGGAKSGTSTPATYAPNVPGVGQTQLTPGRAASESGGSFDFNHWDLVQMRQLADIRPDYHIVKNYKLLGRFDTLVLKDADFFAFYRPWYDAEGTLKNKGVAQPNRDWTKYSQQRLQEQYFRNDLREYYGQLNFTDNFSMRIGKQQVIWSEADALSGTEITNPNDLTYHWTHFETAENLRRNVRMIKFNYILPDFLKTANNELEAFVIPGDYQGDTAVVGLVDGRNPWTVRAPQSANTHYDQRGNPFRVQTFADDGQFPNLGAIPAAAFGIPLPGNLFTQFDPNPGSHSASNRPRNSLDNSEFGMRYSSLLPIGNGLQASFIYLYEARDSKTGLCSSCPNPANPSGGGTIKIGPGQWVLPGHFDYPLHAGSIVPFGTLRVLTSADYRRNHFFGLTGTYYDKDLTDMVFRYDALYAPKYGINVAALNQNARSQTRSLRTANNDSSSRWTEYVRGILAADRPTYIPWISKQHTFLVAQFVETWYPDLPDEAVPSVAQAAGKVRRYSNFFFLASTNWLVNGQLTSTNAFAWDVDDNCGNLGSTNVFRYSRNILMGLNAIWYLGRSGRFTDPFLFSRDQRISEIEATLSYEI